MARKLSGTAAMRVVRDACAALFISYREARYAGTPCSDLIKAKAREKKRYLDTLSLRDLAYVDGYDKALWDTTWRSCVQWMHYHPPTGRLLISSEVEALSKPGSLSAWMEIDVNAGRYVWLDDNGKPRLDKPFTEYVDPKKEKE